MAGSGWQQLAASAKELGSASAAKAKGVTASLGKAVVSSAAAGARGGAADDVQCIQLERGPRREACRP